MNVLLMLKRAACRLWFSPDWHDAPAQGLMRRRVGGRWEYRTATAAEQAERWASEAW